MISDLVDQNLSEIRTGLSVTILAAGVYVIYNSRHCKRITSVDSLSSLPYRLGGVFHLHGHSIFFDHVPAFHRLLFTPTTLKKDGKEYIPVKWIGMALVERKAILSAIDGRPGKLIVYSKKDNIAHGLILTKRNSYSPILRDPALKLLKKGAIAYSKNDLVPGHIARKYESFARGGGRLSAIWRFLIRK
jgi:hypothetical protein